MLESAGFETPTVRWLEGFAGTIYFQIRWLAKTMPLWPFSGGGLYAWLLGALLLLMYPFLHLAGFPAKISDRARRHTDRGYISNYFVIVIKENLVLDDIGPSAQDNPVTHARSTMGV